MTLSKQLRMVNVHKLCKVNLLAFTFEENSKDHIPLGNINPSMGLQSGQGVMPFLDFQIFSSIFILLFFIIKLRINA
jgi:hypothetical protein